MLALEFPPVSHLIEWPDLLGSGPFAVNKVVLLMWLGGVLTFGFFYLAARKTTTGLVPSGVQNVDSPQVRILSMNALQRPDRIVIVGEVVNEDTVPAYVNVGATLLRPDGSTFAQESSFDKISHTLLPKQVSPYRIDFPEARMNQVKSVRMDVKSLLVAASAELVIDTDAGVDVTRGSSQVIVEAPHRRQLFFGSALAHIAPDLADARVQFLRGQRRDHPDLRSGDFFRQCGIGVDAGQECGSGGGAAEQQLPRGALYSGRHRFVELEQLVCNRGIAKARQSTD